MKLLLFSDFWDERELLEYCEVLRVLAFLLRSFSSRPLSDSTFIFVQYYRFLTLYIFYKQMPAIKINNTCFLIFLFLFCQTNTQKSLLWNSPFSTLAALSASFSLNCTQPVAISSTVIQLGNCEDLYYILPLSVGTPGQEINFIVSTSSSLFWLLAGSASQSGFQVNSSSTLAFTNNVVQYQVRECLSQGYDQDIFGIEAYDKVYIGKSNVNVNNTMLLVQQQLNNPLQNSSVYGVLGMGLQQVSTNLLYNAYQTFQLQTSTYTLSLARGNESSFLYYNQDSQGDEVYISCNSDSIYQLTVIGFDVEGVEFQDYTAQNAIISSAQPFFFVNQRIYSTVVKNYLGGCINGCSCQQVSSWPTFSIMFQGVEIYLTPQSYVIQQEDGTCTFGFGSLQDKNSQNFILGTSLFYSYNVTFNQNQATIGFQGNLTMVQIIDFTFFQVTQWLMLLTAIALLTFAVYLVTHLKVTKHEKHKKYSEITLSSRFLDTS